jgi:uncharacterized protein
MYNPPLRARVMHVNVKNILADDVGASSTFRIADEHPQLADLDITEPVNGEVILLRIEDGIIAEGRVSLVLRLQCHRCLVDFDLPLSVKFSGDYALNPKGDQWPIAPNDDIDLGPLLRQEALLSVPIKQLCRPDCFGLCVVCGLPQDKAHTHPANQISHHPRIVKGK